MYVRFVFAKPEKATNRYVGILHNRRYGGWGQSRIAEIYVWFRKNLKRPPLQAFSQDRARCWFKPDAHACIDRIVELAHLLQRRGERIWHLRTRYPGLVTYEDPHQVVAIPAAEFPSESATTPDLR